MENTANDRGIGRNMANDRDNMENMANDLTIGRRFTAQCVADEYG